MVSHQQDGIQRLIDKFSDACDFFGVTISQGKMKVMGQATSAPPCITVIGEELEVVHQFQYLGSTTTDTLSLAVELSNHIGKALTSLSKLTSTLLYGSESLSTYSTQKWKLQVFHLRFLCRILGTAWQDKMRNNDILSRAGIPSMFTLPCQCHLHWVGHINRMEDGCIPKDLHYHELCTGARCRGHPKLCFKDVCKCNMKACNTDTESWEAFEGNRLCGSSKCHKD